MMEIEEFCFETTYFVKSLVVKPTSFYYASKSVSYFMAGFGSTSGSSSSSSSDDNSISGGILLSTGGEGRETVVGARVVVVEEEVEDGGGAFQHEFGLFLGVVLLTFFAVDGLVALFATLADSQQTASAFSGAITGVLSLFNGFTANRLNMPVWLYWMQYLSPFYWGFVATAIPLMQSYQPPPRVSSSSSSSSSPGTSESSSSIELIKYSYPALAETFDWHPWMKWAGPSVLAVMWVVFRTAAAVAMSLKRGAAH